jgi:hypothetical protein
MSQAGSLNAVILLASATLVIGYIADEPMLFSDFQWCNFFVNEAHPVAGNANTHHFHEIHSPAGVALHG